jgi:cysteine desulfurase / selenocysteine lyase
MDLEVYRETEFPLVRDCCYLNHAASAPLPRRAAAALCEYARQRERRHLAYLSQTQDYDLTGICKTLSALLHCDPQKIGFVPSTCDGIAAAANSYPWQPGDNVIVPSCEFPGAVSPWMNLIPRGVEVKFCSTPSGHVDLDLLLAEVTPYTRVIAVSHVQWNNGFKVNLGTLGRFCRERGILTVVDAIQSLGVQPVDVQAAQIDVLVAGTYKWLIGIPGVAIFYVSDYALQKLRPDRTGKLNVISWDGVNPIWQLGGRRFLVGSTNDAALCVLERSAELLLEVDVEAIHTHTATLIQHLGSGLRTLGMTVTSSSRPEHQSSILSFTTGDSESDECMLRWLLDHNVIVSRRSSGIRVAPHFYNTMAEIDELLAAVKEAIHCGAVSL